MADQKNRGGQKAGNQNPADPQHAQGANTAGTGARSDADKQQDRRSTPDDAARQPTDQQR